MISYIKGTVSYKESDSIVVENHGIGYQIRTPARLADETETGQAVCLFTYLYVREDNISLFGFSSREELRTFQTLLGISGIGPKAALSVLSTMTVEELYYAVFSEDVKGISRTPGIGPKGAKRMIVELKDKLDLADLESMAGVPVGSDPSGNPAGEQGEGGESIAETIQALVALGYSNAESYRAVHSVPEASSMDSEHLLKEALKKMLTFL